MKPAIDGGSAGDPVIGSVLRSDIEGSENLRTLCSGNAHSWCFLTPDRAPVATIVATATATQFLMADATAADLELPWLFGTESEFVTMEAVIAVPRGTQIDVLYVQLQSATLITSVTTSSGPWTAISGTIGNSMSGWSHDSVSWSMYRAELLSVYASDLGTTRSQALKMRAFWNADQSVLAAGGDDPIAMAIPVKLVQLSATDGVP